MTPSARRMPGAGLGVLLAVFNVMVISAGMGLASHEGGIAVFVFIFTIIPGVLAGAVLGALADFSATRPPVVRVGFLASLSIAVLSGLAGMFGLMAYVPLTAIPTLIAVVLLEGATRRRPTEPPIPVAMVR